MTNAFISYSRKDRAIADYIAAELRNRGAEVFIDYQKLIAGEDFIGRLGKEIEIREYFILIISPRSVASKWVKAEVSWALHNEKIIIPVLLETASMTDFFFLIRVEQVDFQGWNLDGNVDSAIVKLAKAVGLPEKAISKKESVPKAKVTKADKEVVSEEVVDIKEEPPTFAKEDISELFRKAVEIADEDPERAYFLYQRVIEIDPYFMMGQAREFVSEVIETFQDRENRASWLLHITHTKEFSHEHDTNKSNRKGV